MCPPNFDRSIVRAYSSGSFDVEDDEELPDLVDNDGNIANLAVDVFSDNGLANRPTAANMVDELPPPPIQQTLRWGEDAFRLYIDDSQAAVPALQAADQDFILRSDASEADVGVWPFLLGEGTSAISDVISRLGLEEGRDIHQHNNLLFSDEGRNAWGEGQHWCVALSSFARIFASFFEDGQSGHLNIAIIFSHVAKFIPIEQPFIDDVIFSIPRGTQNTTTSFYSGEEMEQVD